MDSLRRPHFEVRDFFSLSFFRIPLFPPSFSFSPLFPNFPPLSLSGNRSREGIGSESFNTSSPFHRRGCRIPFSIPGFAPVTFFLPFHRPGGPSPLPSDVIIPACSTSPTPPDRKAPVPFHGSSLNLYPFPPFLDRFLPAPTFRC